MADNRIAYSLANISSLYTSDTDFPGHGWYGNGEDGDVVLSTTTTTLARDMAYNNLTINAGSTLVTAGYRIFVKNVLLNNGTISVPTAAASGATAGAVAASAHLGVGVIGVVGNTTTVGAAGTANTKANGGAGGAGGAGSASTPGDTAGGAAGAITNTMEVGDATIVGHPLVFTTGTALNSTDKVNGGAAGGAGGSDGSHASGASGAGGGVMFLVARIIDNEGSIQCHGGVGAAANGTGNSGGGGGGGGGFIGILTQHFVGNLPDVAGGLGGAGHGTGAAGSPGAVGNYIIMSV